MGRMLSPILREFHSGRVGFWCPGCETVHHIPVGPDHTPGKAWGYNGNADSPTFTPSIHVTYPHWVPPAPTDQEQVQVTDTCHSFVTDGQIQFLGDCTHPLAGQTVPLPPFPEQDDG